MMTNAATVPLPTLPPVADRAAGLTAAGGAMPLYAQLHSLLVRRLQAGEWPVGALMPTLTDLMAEYGVARVTVREALARLEEDGVITRARGRGTTVVRDLSRQQWLLVPTTWDQLVEHVGQLSARIHTLAAGPAHLPPGDYRGRLAPDYWRAERLHRTPEGTAYSLAELWLDDAIYRRRPEAFTTGAALPLLRAMPGITLGAAWQTLVVSTADRRAAQHLGLTVGAPVVQARRQAVDDAGRLIYLADITYPAQHLRIETRLV